MIDHNLGQMDRIETALPETPVEYVRQKYLLGVTALELARRLGMNDEPAMELAQKSMDLVHVNPGVVNEVTSMLGDMVTGLVSLQERGPGNDASPDTVTAHVVDLAQHRRKHALAIRKKREALRTSGVQTRMIAPQEDMDDYALANTFFSQDEPERIAEVFELIKAVTYEVGAGRKQIPDDAMRAFVVLQRTANLYADSDDPRWVDLRAEVAQLRDEIVKRSEGFIFSIVNRLVGSSNSFNLGDLMQEGVLGFMESLERFDLGITDAKVMSFCASRIRGAAVDAMRQSGHIIRQSRRYANLSKALSEGTGDGKSVEDIAYEQGVSVKALLHAADMYDLRSTLSLETIMSYSDNEELTLGDTISDKTQMVEALIFGDNPNVGVIDFDAVLGKFKTRDADIVRMHFGLAPYDEPCTLKVAAAKYGISESRGCQIVGRILHTIYHSLTPDMMALGERPRKRVPSYIQRKPVGLIEDIYKKG